MHTKKMGKWDIGKRIGRGGQASVHEASTSDDGTIRAIKFIKSPYRKKRARFIQEIKMHLDLSKKGVQNVISIIDHNLEEFENGHSDGYIVMPKAETTLEEQIQSGMLAGRTELCLEIFHGIVNGIKEAHEVDVIHRDMKPSNILFLDKSLRIPLVTDFGICFLKDTPEEQRLTDAHETVGAKFFMAPEQERGGVTDVNETADIYALGKLLHYMLTGRTLFRENMSEAFEERELKADPRLRIIYDKILTKTVTLDPAARIQSADALLKIVEDVMKEFGSGGTTFPQITPIQPIPAPSSQMKEPGEIKKVYDSAIKDLVDNRVQYVRLQFDSCRTNFNSTWAQILASIEHQPDKAPQAAQDLIDEQPDTMGLTLAMTRIDNAEVFQDYKLLLENIIRSSEGKAGYAAVHSVPHVLAGFLYMAASVAALRFQSWKVFHNLLNSKFEWYYQSGRPLYNFGFDTDYFFHSEALGRSATKCHDLYRSTISRAELLEILGLNEEELLNIYSQAQMVMCIRATQEDAVVFPDFGRFNEYRVINLLDKVYHDQEYAKNFCKAFNETPQEWFGKLNERFIIIQKWFSGAPYFWRSVRKYEPR